MKQITKIILICSLLCVPFIVTAQEPVQISEPIADSGFEVVEDVSSQQPEEKEVIDEEKDVLAPISTIEPKPLIHIEQLGWNTFKFRSSYRLGLVAYENRWGFGDGQGSSERIVHHSYDKPGVYQVRLEILTEDGQVHSVSNTVSVGFFNLANWRLWVLILLLAGIIVIAAVIAGVTEDKLAKPVKKKKGLLTDLNDESTLNSLADELGDLDSLGQVGMDTHELAEELAFLEEMDMPKLKKKKRTSTKKTKKTSSKPKKKATKEKKKQVVKKKKTSTAKKTTKKKATKKTSQSKKSVKK